MAQEIERKFLVDKFPNIGDFTQKRIQQGYLMVTENENLRIRIINNTKAFVCFKSKKTDLARNEYEFQVSIVDGLEMLKLAKFKLEKVRQTVVIDAGQVDVDFYKNGKYVAEIEFDSEDEANNFTPPDWFGLEVTNDLNYSNIEIAKKESGF